MPKSLFPDSLHPNKEGYVVWADAMQPTLTELMKQVVTAGESRLPCLTKPARDLLKAGDRITLAAHCHQVRGGQGIDVGLADVKN